MKYEISLNRINKISKENLKKLSEDDLMFITNPGRMGDEDGSTFVIKKDGEYKLYRVSGWYFGKSDISLSDMFDTFPKWKELLEKYFDDKTYNGKYKYIDMGFGNGLCVDNRIYDQYYPYLKNSVKENGAEFDNNEMYELALNYSSWMDALIDMVLDESKKASEIDGFDDRNADFQMFKLKKKSTPKNIHSTDVEIPTFLKNSNNEELYTYVSVIYDDDIVATTIGEPSFYYKTDIDDIDIDDKVLVDRNGKEVIGIVVDIEKFKESNVPFPIEKTKSIIKVIEKSTSPEETSSIFVNDDYYNRMDVIEDLDCIELDKENINLLSKNEIIFIEDDESDGSLYFMDDKTNLYHIDVKYNEDKSINKDLVFSILPEYKDASFENQKDYKAINLGMGHALLIKTKHYNKYTKLLKANIKYEDEFQDFYNAYCYWMKYAIEYLNSIG